MQRIPWAVVLVALSCGKSDGKQKDKKPPDKPEPKKSLAAGEKLAGTYRLDAATMDGKKTNLEEAFRASLEGDGKQVLVFMRMTFEFADGKLTIGMDQVMGEPGGATYCSVRASGDLAYDGRKLSLPALQAHASAGLVKAKGASSSKDTTKCNVSLDKGTYEVERGEKTIDIHGKTPDGDITLHLVADEKDVDLKELAAKHAEK